VNTNSRLNLWFGVMIGLVLSSCGGRSVLDDERAYGEDGALGLNGRGILPLTSATVDVGATPSPTAGTVGPVTGTSPTQTTPAIPTGTTGTGVTIPVPTVAPTAVSPVNPSVPTATAMPTTGVPTTTAVPTTGVPTSEPDDGLPALVPFPPAGFEPNIPPGFEGVEWQDPWQCYPRLYNAATSCSIDFSCVGRAYNSAYCSLNSGIWSCECKNNTDYGWFQFNDDAIVEGEACRVAGALCVSTWPEEQAKDCYGSEDQGQDYCSYSNTCNYELGAGTDINAVKTTQDYTYCNHSDINGVEYVSCGCSNWSEFSVAWDPNTSCQVASAACAAGLDDGSLGEVACTWNSSSSDLSSCYDTQRCTQPATAGGIPVDLISVQQTSCYNAADDSWECQCNYTDVRAYTADSSREACDIAQLDCQAKGDLLQ
jgi:hypothetical protein